MTLENKTRISFSRNGTPESRTLFLMCYLPRRDLASGKGDRFRLILSTPPPSPAAPSPDEHSALCVGELTENGSDREVAFTTELPLQGIRVSRMGNYVLLLLKKEKKKSLAGSIDRQTW